MWNGSDLGLCLGEATVPSCGQATMMVSAELKWLILKGKSEEKKRYFDDGIGTRFYAGFRDEKANTTLT
jgi:hypothetical protein